MGTVGRISATLAIVASMLIAVQSAGASGEFEENDSFNTSAGPISSGTTYQATLETDNDEDYYFFYLPQRTQLQFTLKNTSDPDVFEDYGMCFAAVHQTPSAYIWVDDADMFVDAGETGSGAVTLPRGKYHLLVEGCDAPRGMTYQLTLNPPGVTSDYTPFAQACAAAHPSVATASRKLSRAKAKLAKAKAHHNRKKVRKRRKKVKVRKAAFKAAAAAEQSACSVPQ